MAITVGTVTSGSSASSSTLTISFTCDASTTILAVPVVIGDNGRTISGVTYNGVSLSLQKSQTSSGTSQIGAWFTMPSPPTGAAHNIVVTCSGGSGGDWISAAGVCLLGTKTTGFLGNTQGLTDTTTSSNYSTAAANSIILNCVKISNTGGNTAPSVANGETVIMNINTSSNHYSPAAYKIVGAAGAYSTGWTPGDTQNTNNNLIAVIEIEAATPPVNGNFLTFM